MLTQKEQFFNSFHASKAALYGVEPGHIRLIRYKTLHEKVDEEELIEWVKNKLKPMNKTRTHSMLWYQKLLGFISNSVPIVWNDITAKTHFDREESHA